ncbi:MAG: hypothetical protein CMJ48_04960 [Planctomycetaceae bacterium]|nr:hypothetical protein [Planctomycetaceae bacterium]
MASSKESNGRVPRGGCDDATASWRSPYVWTTTALFGLLAISGCGNGNSGNGTGNGEADEFAPGNQAVDLGASGRAKPPSRFDLPVQTGSGKGGASAPVPTGPKNPSAGTGFGAVIGVTDYWKNQRKPRDEGSEFETLSEEPDSIPPFNWSVEIDTPDEPPVFAPVKKNQRIQVPTGAARTSANDIVFANVPTGVVALGQNATKKDKREVWDLMKGEKIGTIRELGATTIMHAISPDGHYFAGVTKGRGFDKTIGIWDVLENQPVVNITLEGNMVHLFGIAMPRPDLLVAGTTFGKNRHQIWEIPSGQPIQDIDLGWGGSYSAPAFSPGGKYLAVSRRGDHRHEVITIYDLDSVFPAGELSLPDYDIGWKLSITGLTFSPDGKELAASLDGWSCSKLIVWSMDDGSIVDHMTFKKKLKDDALGDHSFAKTAAPLTFFPGNQRLLAFETLILDRDVDAAVWKLPGGDLRNNFPGTRWPLDESHVSVLTSAGRKGFINAYKLDEKKVEDSKKRVEKLIARKPSAPSALVQPGMPGTPDWGSVSYVGPADVKWSVSGDPSPAPTTGARNIQLDRPKGSFHEVGFSKTGSPKALVARSGARFWGSRIPNGNQRPDALLRARSAGRSKAGADGGFASAGAGSRPRTWIDVYDLNSGKRSFVLKLTYEGDLVSVSPDGSKFLVLDTSDAGRLDLYQTEDGQHLAGWQPYGKEVAKESRMVVSATMSDETHVVTLSGSGQVVVWQVPEMKALVSASNASQPALSAGGKYLSYSDGRTYYFVEVATGGLVGKVPDVGDVQSAAYHPNGMRLALISSHNGGYYLFTVDLPTGTVSAPFPVPVVSGFLRWFGERYVLLDNRKLVDVEQKVVAWTYELA